MDGQSNILNKITDKFEVSFLIENGLFSIAPICALLAAKNGKISWLKCEIAIYTILGACLIIQPEILMSYVLNSKLQNYHYFICGMYGSYLIFSILAPLYLLNSFDESIFYGHFWAKIISNSLIIAENFLSYYQDCHWNYKLFCLFTSFFLIDLLINAYFLWNTTKPWARHPYHDKVDIVARFDTYAYLTLGIIVYAFPERFLFDLNGSNSSHISLCRACASILLSLSFESYCMSEFIFVGDKKKFMLSRLTGGMLKIAAVFYGFYILKIFSLEAFVLLMSLNLIYNLIVLYGYKITPKVPNSKDE